MLESLETCFADSGETISAVSIGGDQIIGALGLLCPVSAGLIVLTERSRGRRIQKLGFGGRSEREAASSYSVIRSFSRAASIGLVPRDWDRDTETPQPEGLCPPLRIGRFQLSAWLRPIVVDAEVRWPILIQRAGDTSCVPPLVREWLPGLRAA